MYIYLPGSTHKSVCSEDKILHVCWFNFVSCIYLKGRLHRDCCVCSGVVLDSGDGVSHSVPVFDGYCLPHAVQRFNLAGADVTLQLRKVMTSHAHRYSVEIDTRL